MTIIPKQNAIKKTIDRKGRTIRERHGLLNGDGRRSPLAFGPNPEAAHKIQKHEKVGDSFSGVDEDLIVVNRVDSMIACVVHYVLFLDASIEPARVAAGGAF